LEDFELFLLWEGIGMEVILPLEEVCSCGRVHGLAVRRLWIEEGAVSRLPELCGENGWRRPAILCDGNTWEAAGRAVSLLLPQAETAVLSPEGLHADEHGVEAAEERLPGDSDVLLAVGSGTIHDITRFLAFRRGVPFVSVPTAASVDGFVSTVAAMTWQGCKKTLPAAAPLYVLADSRIFPNAPKRLTASGAADLLGKYTALLDWRVSALLTGEYLCERVCSMEQEALSRVCAVLPAIAAGERAACEDLMYGLLLSGLAMQMVGNSRPASGAEHHLSHLWEMGALAPCPDAYHGEKVGVGLLAVSRAYRRFGQALEAGELRPAPWRGIAPESLRGYFPKAGMAEVLMEENTPDPLSGLSGEAVCAKRDGLVSLISALPEEERLRSLLEEAGAPVSLPQLGLSEALRRPSLMLAPYVRRRLTLLRLFWLFQPETVWELFA